MRLWKRRSGVGSRPFADAFRSTRRGRATLCLAAALLLAAPPPAVASARIDGLARVTDEGHLVLAGRTVVLAGIDIPTFDRTCRREVPPFRCGPRAVLILDQKVRGFVQCDLTGERARHLLEGRCTITGRRLFDERVDLAAELLREGWAFARDDAPGLYRSYERLARSREIGIWRDSAVRIR
jgi:endonuclease YncB( thermonuclease family)